VKKDTTAA